MNVPGRLARLVGAPALCLLLGGLGACGSSHGTAGKAAEHAAVPSSRTFASSAQNPGTPKEPNRTVGEFGKRGTAAGEFQEPFGIAVDRRSGDVYVVDTNNNRVDKFTSAGRFLLAWGWGVADGKSEALQTCTRACFPGLGGPGAGELRFAEGIAVDNSPSSPSRGDLYVVDIMNHRVQKFDPSGRLLLSFGGGVNRTAVARHDRANEDVCPVDRNDVCGPGTEARGAAATGGRLEFAVEGSFIAVGPDGTVYLGQRNSVQTFSPQGRYRSRIRLTPEVKSAGSHEAGGVNGLAVDASGDMYVIRHGVSGVNEYAPSGALLRTLEPGGPPAYDEGPNPSLALDPSGRVFVDVYENYQHRIDEFDASGGKLASFDRGQKALPQIADKEDGLPGMAYDPRTERLYVVNADVNVTPMVARVRIIAPPQP